jgi:hypothetical protein
LKAGAAVIVVRGDFGGGSTAETAAMPTPAAADAGSGGAASSSGSGGAASSCGTDSTCGSGAGDSQPLVRGVSWGDVRGSFDRGCTRVMSTLDVDGAYGSQVGPQRRARKKDVKDAAAVVRSEATKVGLLLSSPAGAEDASGVLQVRACWGACRPPVYGCLLAERSRASVWQSFLDSLCVFGSWCRGLNIGFGPTLRQNTRSVAEAVFNASV